MTVSRRAFHDVLKKSCFQAGEVILKNFGKKKKIQSKGINDWVTEIDFKAENVIIKCIKKYFPESSFLAEESGNSERRSELHWIIDPIDGTNNYIHNHPFFSVSIALSIDGVISYSAVFDPLRKEFFFAEKGRGSFLNKKKIVVSNIKKLSESLLCTGFITSNKKYTEMNMRNFKKLIYHCQSIRRDGSAALDLAYVASGRLDAFWVLGLKPWDTAAGILLVKEAGGIVTKANGKNYSIYDKSLLTSNQFLHKELIRNLKQNSNL